MVCVLAIDRRGSLRDLTTILANYKVNVLSVASSRDSKRFFFNDPATTEI
ncbi:ACT domain-containing protein [Salmonella enterica subsp. enterica serovar Hadar]|nr:ACT domain-containing protein [Salmonella enterica]TAO64646.1 ACT domain-containing protein [Salmonella enterica subsp. enterica serovar Hadar]